VIGIPGLAGLAYRNNQGKATVTVCHHSRSRPCPEAAGRL
jgi:hypothetical protein